VAHYVLEGMQVGCGTMGMPTATVRLRGPNGRVAIHAAVGTGPVDAAFKAIDSIVGVRVELVEYHVHAVTEGIDALGEVSVRIRPGHAAVRPGPIAPSDQPRAPIARGHGADTDIVVASAKAYLAAVNRVLDETAPPFGGAAGRGTPTVDDVAIEPPQAAARPVQELPV